MKSSTGEKRVVAQTTYDGNVTVLMLDSQLVLTFLSNNSLWTDVTFWFNWEIFLGAISTQKGKAIDDFISKASACCYVNGANRVMTKFLIPVEPSSRCPYRRSNAT